MEGRRSTAQASVVVRRLSPADAAACQMLRLRGLQESPTAFGSSYEEECHFSLKDVAEYLSITPSFGAWTDLEQLVGMVALDRSRREKARHKVHLGGMYVAPEARRQGVGRAVLRAAVDHARVLPGVEQVTLTVVEENTAAIKLYEGFGFVRFGVEPRALKVGGSYYDVVYMALDLSSSDSVSS